MTSQRLHRQHGFSLLELLVGLAVLAIVTAFAVTAWHDQAMAVRRSEALAGLLQIAARQEQFHVQSLRYASGAELSAAPPAGLGSAAVGVGYEFATTGAGNTYQATATVRITGPQEEDSRCWLFGIDSSGRRWAESRGGRDTSTLCWRH